jgi:hypothetical protein
MQVLYLTEVSVSLKYNVTLYIKNCFRKRTECGPRGDKIRKFSADKFFQNPPTIAYDTTPNFLSPVTICHLSILGIVWSLSVDDPSPHLRILKKGPKA